jgi:hypothetical protein
MRKIFSFYDFFLSGARPALPMEVAPKAVMGCLQPIIGSKLLRLVFPFCLDNSSPCRNHNVIAITWLLIVFWFDRTLTDAHGQRGKISKFSRVNGLAASALGATSQPMFLPPQAYLRETPFFIWERLESSRLRNRYFSVDRRNVQREVSFVPLDGRDHMLC